MNADGKRKIVARPSAGTGPAAKGAEPPRERLLVGRYMIPLEKSGNWTKGKDSAVYLRIFRDSKNPQNIPL